MSSTEIYQRLTGIFRTTFDDDTLTISPTTSAKDVDGWDSFNHINIVVATEQAFGIKFTTAEIQVLKNIGDFVALIEKKSAK